MLSPAYAADHADSYPANQECVTTIFHPDCNVNEYDCTGYRMSLMFDDFDVHPSDRVEVYDGQLVGGIPLHQESGFTGPDLPRLLLTAESGLMTVRFVSDAVKNTVSH